MVYAAKYVDALYRFNYIFRLNKSIVYKINY